MIDDHSLNQSVGSAANCRVKVDASVGSPAIQMIAQLRRNCAHIQRKCRPTFGDEPMYVVALVGHCNGRSDVAILVAGRTEQHASRFIRNAIKGTGVETSVNNEMRRYEFVMTMGRNSATFWNNKYVGPEEAGR